MKQSTFNKTDLSSSHIDRHRVVIVGGGFGGLCVAKELRRADVNVTLVDRTNHHLFQPLLYQVATGILSEGAIAAPIRDILQRQKNVQVLLGEVQDVDLKTRHITIDTIGFRSEIQYDSLIVAAGAKQSYFGHPEFAQYAPGMKTIDHALELRGRIFGAFEMAEREADPEARRRWLTFVVIGGGPTGVEVAGQLVELSHSIKRNYRNIDPSEARIIILDAGPEMLGSFPEVLRRRTESDLRELGIEIHLGTRVKSVDELGILTDSTDPNLQRIEAATKIWAAGVQASPLGRILAEKAGAELDRAGRVKVEPDCTLPSYPEVFVIGDLMSLQQLPQLAQVATQSGHHVAQTIIRRLAGDRKQRPFRYRDLGSMATISKFRAIGVIGKLQFSGFIAWVMWLVIHLARLAEFKNRLAVLFNWAISFFSNSRPHRVITSQQVFGRLALEAQPELAEVKSSPSSKANS
jgi:NADH:ubiquinone reductase (H+-translocating)